MSDASRSQLARLMVGTLPTFGHWANGFREFDTPYGRVGFRQLSVLWTIRHKLLPGDGVSPSLLAEHFDVQPSVMTRALAKLESAGFIERAVDPSDRRRCRIDITEKGTHVSEFVEALYIQEMLDSVAFLSDEQIQELRRNVEILGRIVHDLEVKRKNRTTRLIG